MRDLLRKNLGRSLGKLPEFDRLETAWPVACGAALAGRGRLLAFEAGVVSVEVTDEAWLRQMESMGPMLQHELARISGVRVSAIHFTKRTRRA